MEWTTVKVPKQVLPMLKEIKEKTNKPYWQIIVDALSHYHHYLRHYRHFENTDAIDKVAYYIVKATYSMHKFKDNPDDNNWQWLVKTVEQLKERLDVDCSEVIAAGEKLRKQYNGKNKHTFNMAMKQCVIKLVMKMLEAGEGES